MNFYTSFVFIGIIALSLGDLDSNAPHHRQKRACPFAEDNRLQQQQQEEEQQPQQSLNRGCQRNQPQRQFAPVPRWVFSPQQPPLQQFYPQGFPIQQPAFRWPPVY